MNSKAILGICMAVSAAIGAAAGTGITYSVMKRRCDERIAQEIEEYKASHGSKRLSKRVEALVSEDSKPDIHDPLNKAHSSLEGGPVSLNNRRTNYAAMAKNYRKSEEDILAEMEHPEEGKSGEEAVSGQDVEPFEIISAEEYNADSENTVTELIWYLGDDDLRDSYGEEIEARERLVGNCLETIRESGVNTDSEGLVYVRNNDLGIIYAIEAVQGTFEDNA